MRAGTSPFYTDNAKCYPPPRFSDRPKFVGEDKVIVKKGDTKAIIKVKGHFNPVPTAAHWEFRVSGNTYILNVSETSGDFKTEEMVSVFGT